MNPADGYAQLFGEVLLLPFGMRQELVQRGIEETDGRRISLERAEDADEVLALIGQQLGKRSLPLLERFRKNHLAHGVDAIALEEHVLGARQADALRAKRNRIRGLLGRVGIGANA